MMATPEVDPALTSRCRGRAPRDLRDTAFHDADLYETVIRGMIGRGVMPVDDGLELWFLSAAHSAEDVATTLSAFEDSLREARA